MARHKNCDGPLSYEGAFPLDRVVSCRRARKLCHCGLRALRWRTATLAYGKGPDRRKLTANRRYVQLNVMRADRLHYALDRLSQAIREVESELSAMKAEHDPLASHIFVSRRNYRNAYDTKSGKRREVNARVSFNTACELGFRGSLDEWDRLMGAVARR